MSVTNHHIMASNNRLLRQVHRHIYHDAESAWIKVFSTFCKRQAEYVPNKVMQFKYKGVQYHLNDDVPLRAGVRPLAKELEEEFKEVYSMFVSEVDNEQRIFQNMMSHAIRIAKYTEDLIDLLPPVFHDPINESGFFQKEDKPLMSVAQAEEFKAQYEQYYGLFEMRKTIGNVM